MNQTFLKRIFAYVLAFCCAFSLFVLVGCDDVTPDTDNKDDKKVDVCIFMGQSNMAGRGEAQDSVVFGEGRGYEFRAVSDPSKLYPVQEPSVFETIESACNERGAHLHIPDEKNRNIQEV